jgi:hypothetical protein
VRRCHSQTSASASSRNKRRMVAHQRHREVDPSGGGGGGDARGPVRRGCSRTVRASATRPAAGSRRGVGRVWKRASCASCTAATARDARSTAPTESTSTFGPGHTACRRRSRPRPRPCAGHRLIRQSIKRLERVFKIRAITTKPGGSAHPWMGLLSGRPAPSPPDSHED